MNLIIAINLCLTMVTLIVDSSTSLNGQLNLNNLWANPTSKIVDQLTTLALTTNSLHSNSRRSIQQFSSTLNENVDIIQKVVNSFSNLISNFEANLKASGVATPLDDAFMSVPQIIKQYGYKVEEHKVWTADGYLLTLYRIPAGKSNSQFKTKEPVIIQHGLFCSSSAWVVLQNNSLPFLLANKDYDVWIPNFRGSTHSMEHQRFRSNNVQFWNFGLDEIGTYDVPAIINYVLKETDSQKLNWIGHSMGCASLFVAINQDPSLNDKINRMVAMAPAVYVRNLISPFFKLVSYLTKEVVQLIGNVFCGGRFIPSLVQTLLFRFGPYFCSGRITGELCKSIIFLSVGANPDQATVKTLGIVGGHLPSEGSIKTLTNYGQFVQRGKFEAYDYGVNENKRLYNSTEPRPYTLSKIQFPILVFYGLNDLLVTPRDARRTISELKTVQEALVVNHTKWSHFDFLYGKDAGLLVYDRSIQFLEE